MPSALSLISRPPHPGLPPQGGKGRKRPCSFLLIGSFLISVLGTLTLADEPAALRVCLLEDNLPSSSRRDNSGFDLDTAKAVAEALGRPLAPVWVKNDSRITEIEDSDFPLRRLSRNECDSIFSVPGAEAVKDSPKLTVGAPYYGAAFELVGRDGNAPASLAALGDTPVAVQSQTIANFVLNARKAKMRTFFSVEEALGGLVKGEATAALLWGPTTGWYLHNHPEMKLVFAAGYEPPAAVRWNEHVATRKSDTALREAIDKTLAQLDASGTLRTLLTRYGIPFHRPFDTTYSLAEMQKLR
ncbi:MAG: transporter substrate-binding domain-containing protein [Deltaproteobacteria bacterium]|nr:transporter substrate-binding domain-containing protein [Deltaproteobacteria bacterium]